VRRRRFRILATALAAPALLAYTPAPAFASAGAGRPAPAAILRTFDGQAIRIDELRGKVVVLNLWATWCVPCRAELPLLDAYQRRHAVRGLRIFAVATQDSVPASFLKPLADITTLTLVRRMSGIGYPVLGGVPTNYVIDRQGIVRYAKSGALDAEDLAELVGPLLAENGA
jgi:thiol-disulfide isomerase/thioredoxin